MGPDAVDRSNPSSVRWIAADPGSGPDDGALREQLPREGLGDLPVVDDRGGGRVDRADGRGVRLDLAEVVPVEEPEALDAVGGAALEERLEPRQLGLRGGDDHLADRVDADPVLRAELLHQPGALDAEPRLVRAGLVVDPRVDDAAVVPGLVRGQPRLLLEDHQAKAGALREERARRREPHDAPSDHGQIEPVAHAHRLDPKVSWLTGCLRTRPHRYGRAARVSSARPPAALDGPSERRPYE